MRWFKLAMAISCFAFAVALWVHAVVSLDGWDVAIAVGASLGWGHAASDWAEDF